MFVFDEVYIASSIITVESVETELPEPPSESDSSSGPAPGFTTECDAEDHSAGFTTSKAECNAEDHHGRDGPVYTGREPGVVQCPVYTGREPSKSSDSSHESELSPMHAESGWARPLIF